MNLFLARLTGKLMTTEKFEKYVRQLLADQKRYREVEQSPELQEFYELEKVVSSARFQETKHEYQTKKYKETVECKNHNDFIKAKKDKTVKKYLEAVNDEERDQLKGAIAVKNYLQLKGIVEEEGFETRRLFWADPKRWKQTEEYRTESRYEALKNSADIKFFLHAPKKRIEEVEQWIESFKAAFHSGSLQENGFETGFHMPQKSLRKDFSIAGQAQAYVGEKNVNILNDNLSIIMQKEAFESPVWDEKIGFRPKQFEYTSAIINSADHFQQSEGIFMAKVKASGRCHSAIMLTSEDGKKALEMYHYNGRRIEFGSISKEGKETEVIRGLHAQEWHIITVIVQKNQVSWYINEHEVKTIVNPMKGQKMHFTVQAFAPEKNAGEGRIDVAWLRAFVKK